MEVDIFDEALIVPPDTKDCFRILGLLGRLGGALDEESDIECGVCGFVFCLFANEKKTARTKKERSLATKQQQRDERKECAEF